MKTCKKPLTDEQMLIYTKHDKSIEQVVNYNVCEYVDTLIKSLVYYLILTICRPVLQEIDF